MINIDSNEMLCCASDIFANNSELQRIICVHGKVITYEKTSAKKRVGAAKLNQLIKKTLGNKFEVVIFEKDSAGKVRMFLTTGSTRDE